MRSTIGRLRDIENVVAGTLNTYSNLKMQVRSRPRFIDPQLLQGSLRFGKTYGFNFTAVNPDNKFLLTSNAQKDTYRLTLSDRPKWYDLECLIRIGTSERVGELNIINDLVSTTSLDVRNLLLQDYITTDNIYVSLIGTPMKFFGVSASPFTRKYLLMESYYEVVPGDIILCTPTPDILDSFSEYPVKTATLLTTRVGSGTEPDIVYQYQIELSNQSTLISFNPSVGLISFLKAQPLFKRLNYPDGDIAVPNDIGPCLIDAFYGGLLYQKNVKTVVGLKTYDSFGNQLNGNDWQVVAPNHQMLERSISADTFLLWQRIQGFFQYRKNGTFQAELDADGRFIMSSDLLVPKWNADKQHSWVIPFYAQAECVISIQFEPQEKQIFHVPSNTLFLARPKLLKSDKPIDRIIVAIEGSPNSHVVMQSWQYDGSVVNSLSYYILGAEDAYGKDRWLAGGFSLKPIFLNLAPLKATYSDGVSRYNSGHIYF